MAELTTSDERSSAPPLSLKTRELAVDIVVEHRDQMYAVVSALECSLASQCNHGKNAPDDAPLNEWRLSQVLAEMLGSTDIEESLRSYLGLETLRTRRAL